MTALSPADIASLDQEIAEAQEQIGHLRRTLARDLLPQHRWKVERQWEAAVRHSLRLKKLRRAA